MKLIRLLIAALCLPVFSNAQIGLSSVSPIDVDLGVKLGANFAKLNSDSWDKGYKAGFLGGIYSGIHTKKIGLQVEALFNQARYTTTGTEFYNAYKGIPGFFKNAADSAVNGTINVNYVSIPILLHVKFIGNSWLQLGPQFSSVLSVKDKDDLLKDAKGMFKSGDISGVIGIWLNLPLNLNVGARYIIGFSDLDNTTVSQSWKSRTIQIHIGYNIF